MAGFIISFIFYSVFFWSTPVSAAEIFPNKSIKMLYINTCAECHGRRGKGGGDGPSLRNNDFVKKSDPEVITDLIAKGVLKEKRRYPEKYEEGMPATKNVKEEDIRLLTDLIKSWSQ